MQSVILLPILYITIGLLLGALVIGYLKTRDGKSKSKSKSKNVKIVEKPKMEFSKQILVVTASVTLFIILAATGMSYITQTTDVYAYLIPSIFGSLSIGLGFYYNKAKAENIIKIRNEHGEDAADSARKTMKNEDY